MNMKQKPQHHGKASKSLIKAINGSPSKRPKTPVVQPKPPVSHPSKEQEHEEFYSRQLLWKEQAQWKTDNNKNLLMARDERRLMQECSFKPELVTQKFN